MTGWRPAALPSRRPEALRKRGAARVVLAVPVARPNSRRRLERAFEEVVCLHEPPHFFAVGPWYEGFAQTSDEEVQQLLRAAAHGNDIPAVRGPSARRNGGLDWSRLSPRPVSIPAGQVTLSGDLRSPPVFEEPGALERVTELAADWFARYLRQSASRDAA